MARSEKEEKTPKDQAPVSGIEKEIASNVADIVDLERRQRRKRTVGERLSEVVANFCGSMGFVYIHILWFGAWIVINGFTKRYAFDPFPFTFLTLCVSLEAIFLSTFILISQNHDTQLAERRNHLDLQINLLAEQENTKILEILKAIAERVGVDCEDTNIEALLEPVDPKRLVEEIVDRAGEDDANSLEPVAAAPTKS